MELFSLLIFCRINTAAFTNSFKVIYILTSADSTLPYLFVSRFYFRIIDATCALRCTSCNAIISPNYLTFISCSYSLFLKWRNKNAATNYTNRHTSASHFNCFVFTSHIFRTLFIKYLNYFDCSDTST